MLDIDPVDFRILQLLQQDALMTNKEIAAELNLTTTPVHERIKKLRRDGIISKYTIDLNLKKLKKNLMVYCNVSLKEHAQEYLRQFEKDVQTLPEIVECYCISGGSDFLLKVIVTDMDAYKDFILNKLAAISNIGNTQSNFVITEAKNKTILG
ncbi:MAG: Lrp/AsnC family transcriptional regulator [Leadbetterella sp.]